MQRQADGERARKAGWLRTGMFAARAARRAHGAKDRSLLPGGSGEADGQSTPYRIGRYQRHDPEVLYLSDGVDTCMLRLHGIHLWRDRGHR